jgi:uncharacterized protein with ParB-like and HNH nuclease domain
MPRTSRNYGQKMVGNALNDEWIEKESESEEIQISEYDITATPNDFNVLTISNFIDAGSIVLPPFQRNFIWDLKRASKLIESLILGLPVPQTFLYEDKRNEFLILDGQQRLLSIYFFTKLRFPKPQKRPLLRRVLADKNNIPDEILHEDEYFEPFNLKLPNKSNGAPSIFEGLNYETLGDYKRGFQLRPIRNVIVKQNEPRNDNSSVYEIFDRLNTGGVILKSQEIRANLYYSKFYKILYDLNLNSNWRRLLQKPEEEDKHMQDIELLLRSFAMLIDSDKYSPSMVRFLNEFSHKAKREFTEPFVILLKDIFENFLASMADLPDDIFFRRTSRKFSISLFEAVFVAKCFPLLENQSCRLEKITAEEVSKVASNEKFVRMLQEGTTKQTHVKGRIEIAKEELNNSNNNV